MESRIVSAVSRTGGCVVIVLAFVTGRIAIAQAPQSTEFRSKTTAPQMQSDIPPAHEAPSWLAALNRHGERRIAYAFDLASRGAIHTAQHELLKVLAAVAQALDTDEGTSRHSAALLSAQTALDEAAHFLRAAPQGTRPLSVEVIAAAHRTTLLHEADTRHVTPIVAMQLYYSFAGKQLVLAAGGQPVAAEALFGLGRVESLMHSHPLAGEREASQMSEQKMLVFYQAAWTVNPRHYQAANEYGVLLARFNQWPQACQAFEYSVAQHAEPQNTRNLAAAYERIGKHELAAQATRLCESLSQAGPAGSSAGRVAPAVQWVDLETFGQARSPVEWNSLTATEQTGHEQGAARSPQAASSGSRGSTKSPADQQPSSGSRSLNSNRPLDRLRSIFQNQ